MTISTPGVSALIEAVTTLASVLEKENRALIESDFSMSGLLANAKRDAVSGVESMMSAAHDPAARHRRTFTTLQRRLDAAICQNRVLLQRSIDTQQRIIEMIVRTLEPGEDDHHYPAQYGVDAAHRMASPVALTIRA
ncbi:MAG: hypothetical protein PHT60_06815 [Acidiphilium sp.]|nr:hypothetical protein [Acidiphilium sp.]MDD4935474.1 hypothetical protein [Acidiphilium sp.]